MSALEDIVGSLRPRRTTNHAPYRFHQYVHFSTIARFRVENDPLGTAGVKGYLSEPRYKKSG